LAECLGNRGVARSALDKSSFPQECAIAESLQGEGAIARRDLAFKDQPPLSSRDSLPAVSARELFITARGLVNQSA